MRARITRELIVRSGFSVVAVEADWPDAARVDATSAPTAVAAARRVSASALPDLDVAQPGGERVRRVAARLQRRRSTTRRAGSASTASTSTACTPRSRAVLAYLDRVDPDAAAVGARSATGA